MDTRAIRIHEFGTADVLKWETVPVAEPGPAEALVRHTAVGLNFIDTYHRTGLYPVPLPAILGSEAAGVVEATGDDVTDLAVGDRVVYATAPIGACSERRTLDARHLVRIPEAIDDDTAAAVFLKGLTAWYLLRRSYPVRPGDTVLVYAAAGGVGSLACQWARALGATVIGIVSSAAKAARATEDGCHHVVMAGAEDVAAEVRALTDGVGVAAVYDSVGRDTFFTSLDCLRAHGTLVTFGNASGPVEPFAPAELAKRGSLYVTRPVLHHFVDTRDRLLAAADELFAFLAAPGTVVHIGQRYALRDTPQAHRDLQARKTTGSTLLIP